MKNPSSIRSIIRNNTLRCLAASAFALGAWLHGASAQVLYSTTNDFASFSSGTVSSSYYSVSDSLNGIGNSSNPGGAGGIGSLQFATPGGYNTGVLSFPDPTAASLTALSPGSTRQWSAESGYGPGSMLATSGTITFDIYTGNLTSWSSWGINLNYNDNYINCWASQATNFVGADGNTWTEVVIPYTTGAASSMTYFGMSLAENADSSTAGETVYVDNVQVLQPAAVPEPGVSALAAMGGLGMLGLLRRRFQHARI
jgi:MYXO-CTERM domain-containing protein